MTSTPKLKLFDLTMIVVGLVIGMGIFRTSSDAANAAITPSLFFVGWVAGGLIALCGALTYAEIGSRFPVTGGYYKVFAECYHPSIAFSINCIILISNAASMAGVALVGSEYISQVIFNVEPEATTKAFIAMVPIILFYGVNLLGLRMSSTAQNILMIIKIGMLLLLISSIFFVTGNANAATGVVKEFTAMDNIKSFGLILIAVSFTYGGYQQTINFGEEVHQPRKTIPRGIFIGILLIITLYLLVSYAYYNAIGFEDLKTSRGIASIVVEKMFGPTGRTVASILLFVAVLAYVNVLLLSNPRVMYAMSMDGILPKAFSKKNEKRDVLTVGLTAFAAMGIVVLFFMDEFSKILSFTIFLDSIGMATSAATIFILRKRTKHLDGTGIYKMKLYPLLPLIFIAAYIFVGISIAFDTPKLAGVATCVFAGFLLLYFLVTSMKKVPMNVPLDTSYIINELGEDREHYFNAIAPPIIQTSNFAFKKVADLRKAFEDEMGGYLYSRGLNPTVDILRKKLAALDGAEDCLVFNNGAAAIFAAVLANVKAGDHIISVRNPYTWVQRTFDNILSRFNITTTYIDGRDIKKFEAALQPNTSFIYLESPNSWTFELQPIKEVALFAKRNNIITLMDNSYCTPLHQKPIELGIDLSMQTATKYIGGHSDTLGGVLSGSHQLIKKIFDTEYLAVGSGIQPFNAWLLIRGLRTLPMRLERISNTTSEVIKFLKSHPRIDQIIFPFDESFPQYDLAKEQMSGACGLFTITLKNGTMESITKFCEALKHFMMAVSWGGHESLVIPKCAGIQPQDFNTSNIQHQYIRIYTGLEDPAYLIQDLKNALEA